MTYPTQKQIADALAGLAPRSRADHQKLTQDVLAAFDRDRGHTTTADGYPSSTIGEDGGRTASSLTSVESAASRRLGVKGPDGWASQQRDELRHHLEELWAHMVEASGHMRMIDNRLRLIQGLTGDVVDNTRWCKAHAAIGMQVDSWRTGTVGGRLDAPASLCHPCYDVTRDCLRIVPPPEMVERYERTGSWRVKEGKVSA